MSSTLPPEALVVADSYFGSMKALEGFARQGKYGLFFEKFESQHHDDLHKKVSNNGERSSLYVAIPVPSGEEVPFIANT